MTNESETNVLPLLRLRFIESISTDMAIGCSMFLW